MMPVILLPVVMQNTICFWALLACFAAISDIIRLLVQKRYGLFLLSLLCFAVSYYTMHVLRDGSELRIYGRSASVAIKMLNWPFILFVIVLAAVSAFCIWAHFSIRMWKETHITSASIKESVDSLPAGVCYYLDDGQCIMVNHRMHEICLIITGRSLQDGRAFYDYIKEKSIYALSGGMAVSFRHRMLKYKGMQLHELIADDITELYEKSKELRRDNEKALKLASEMKAYSNTISDTVRRQEMLNAKINIHDEMNRMILATRRSTEGQSDDSERSGILKMWKTQALLLCREAGSARSKNVVSDLNALASAIGMQLIWDGSLKTESTSALSLFLSAAREAMTNAAKHAGAKQMTISVKEDDNVLTAKFTNDGRKPKEPVLESGGLKTLRGNIEMAGGSMNTQADECFTLKVVIPKEEKNHAV